MTHAAPAPFDDSPHPPPVPSLAGHPLPTVMVVDDDPLGRQIMATLLVSCSYRVLEAASAEEAMAILETTRPDLLVVDINLPGQNGLDLTRHLRADPATASLPVVIVTSHSHSWGSTAAEAAGADAFVAKPLDLEVFSATVANRLAASPRSTVRGRVLVVDDRLENLALLRAVLEREGYQVTTAAGGRAALEAAVAAPPDVVILDVHMPDLDGYEVCRRLKAHPATQAAPVVFLTASTDPGLRRRVRASGGDEVLHQPVDAEALLQLVRPLARVGGLLGSLGRLYAALGERERRLHMALEAGQLGTWDVDLATSMVALSPLAAAQLGLPNVEYHGPAASLYAAVHPDDLPDVRVASLAAISSGEPYDIRYRVQVPGGELRWLRSTAGVMHDLTGRPVRLIGVSRDITPDVLASQARELEERGARLQALGQLASGVAHDLNQALALIGGHVELLQRSLGAAPAAAAPGPAAREHLRLLDAALGSAGDTLARLLRFSRAMPEPPLERVDVAALLGEVAAVTSPRWRRPADPGVPPIDCQVQVEGRPVVDGRVSLLREALVNLVFNAVDALPAGGTIRLAAQRANGSVVISVEDDGVGMPPEVRVHALEAYFTTKGERGTGLGLAEVYSIVERHGGRVQLDSAPGRGTTVSLALPAASAPRPSRPAVPRAARAPRPAPPAPARLTAARRARAGAGANAAPDRPPAATKPSRASTAPPQPTPPAAMTPTAPLRILLVDDDPQLLRMTALLLQADGLAIHPVATLEQALQALDAQPFDLVLTDLGLGEGGNGWQVAAAARSIAPAVRVVLLSGWGARVDPEDARQQGVDAVLAKPFTLAQLHEQVDLARLHR